MVTLAKPQTLVLFLLLIIVIVHFALMAPNLNRPFFGFNEDDNAVNGLAAFNLAKFGFLTLKFGMVTGYYDSVQEIGRSFYTNHPQLFVVPTAVFYKLFGVSEATTRLPSMIVGLLSLIAFYFSVYLYYQNSKIALLSSAAYALFPGIAFYDSSFILNGYVLAFSNFAILGFVLAQNYRQPYLKYLLLAVVFLGGFQGWHFYFITVALWLYAFLNRNIKDRTFFLLSLPLVSLAAFALNFLHFYLLKGSGFTSIFQAFGLRTGRIPLIPYAQGYSEWLSSIYTLPASLVGFSYLGYYLYRLARQKKFDLPLIYAFQPFMVILVFQQWTMHAFGPIHWAPFIALSVGLMLNKLLGRDAKLLAAGLLFVVVFAAFSAYNLNYFIGETRLLSPRDINLLQDISSNVPSDAKITLGPDYVIGYAYNSLFEWYLKRNAHHNWETEKVDFVLAFNPNFGPPSRQYVQKLVDAGYELVARGDWLWLFQLK